MSDSKMETKTISFDLKTDDEKGRFSGFGAVYNNVDFGDDVIEPGAFAESLDMINNGKTRVPILWQHDWYEPIGHWENLKETEDGLRGDGLLLIDTDQKAMKAYGLIKHGSISGLSIGYSVRDFEMGKIGTRTIRRLKKLDLREISVVTFPMNDEARIDAVKAAEMTERQMERLLRRDAGLSQVVAKALLAGGFKAVQARRDVGGNEEIAEMIRKNISALTSLNNEVHNG